MSIHFPQFPVPKMAFLRTAFRNEELHNLYSAPNIVRWIKLKLMRPTSHVAFIRQVRHKHFNCKYLREDTTSDTYG